MAHPFPGKVEILPKRRRRSPIGSIKHVIQLSNQESVTINDTLEQALKSRESRLFDGHDLFRALLLRNLKQSSIDMYVNDGDNDDASDDSDADGKGGHALATIIGDRNNFLGFRQFKIIELIRQLKNISRSASPNAFIEYDSSTDEESSSEVSMNTMVTVRAANVKKKRPIRSQAKVAEIEPVPRISLPITIPRATKNSTSRSKISDIPDVTVVDVPEPKLKTRRVAQSKKVHEPEHGTKVQADIVGGVVVEIGGGDCKEVGHEEQVIEKKVPMKKVATKKVTIKKEVVKKKVIKNSIKKQSGKKETIKDGSDLVDHGLKLENDGNKNVGEIVVQEKKTESGKKVAVDTKRKAPTKKISQKVVVVAKDGDGKKKIKKSDNSSKVDKKVRTVAKVLDSKKVSGKVDKDKKVVVAKAVIKNLWKERLSGRMAKLNNNNNNISKSDHPIVVPNPVVPLAQFYSPSPSSLPSSAAVHPIQSAIMSEHSNSINSPRTASILREARLQVDTSKLSPLVLNNNQPSSSSSSTSSSSSSSISSESEAEPAQEPVVKVVKKKIVKKKPVAASSQVTIKTPSPSKKRPGEINCVICGVIKFYSHKQRRFGQYSCESCSKFFYNYIKEPSAYFCDNHGDCIIPSSDTGKPRCKACLLKICLQTYTIPDETRNNLTRDNFLPKLSSAPHVSLISIDTVNVNHDHDTVPSRPAPAIEVKSAKSKKNSRSRKKSVDKDADHPDGLLMMVLPTVSSLKVINQQNSPAISLPMSGSPQQPSPAPKSLKDIRVKRGKVVFAQKESPTVELIPTAPVVVNVVNEICTTTIAAKGEPPLPLKPLRSIKPAAVPKVSKSSAGSKSTTVRGPRIKNVCRTSITGLPVATFGSIGDEDERDEDFGQSEGNIDSDDSDNIPLDEYIWKVIAEDQATKAAENVLETEPEQIKVVKKSKAVKVAENQRLKQPEKVVTKKAKPKMDKDLPNGKKSAAPKVSKPKADKVSKPKEDKIAKPKERKVPKLKDKVSKPKSEKVSKVSVKKSSEIIPDLPLNVPNQELPPAVNLAEKPISPIVPNMNSDTDIEDIEEEKPVKATKKSVKRKVLISDDDEEPIGIDTMDKKKKVTKKRKKVDRVPIMDSQPIILIPKIDTLMINTATGYCSCPEPVLKTPPDNIIVANGSVPVPTSDNETPIRKTKKKVTKDKDLVTDVSGDTFKEPGEMTPSPKKKKVDETGSPFSSPDRPRARKRCNDCTGCKATDCGMCAPCKDKKKFGGPNVRKQACRMRRCLSLFNNGQSLTMSSGDIDELSEHGANDGSGTIDTSTIIISSDQGMVVDNNNPIVTTIMTTI